MPVLFAVPDGVKCAKNAFKEESLAEDTQPVQWRLGRWRCLRQNRQRNGAS